MLRKYCSLKVIASITNPHYRPDTTSVHLLSQPPHSALKGSRPDDFLPHHSVTADAWSCMWKWWQHQACQHWRSADDALSPSFGQSWEKQGVGLDDPYGSLPTGNVLWFYMALPLLWQTLKLAIDCHHPGLTAVMNKIFVEGAVWMFTHSEKNWARK